MNEKTAKSFAGQLRKAFITIVMIPVLLLSSFIFYSMFQSIEQKRLSDSKNIVNLSQADLEQKIALCDSFLRYLVANHNLQDLLRINEQDYREVSRVSKNVSELFYNVLNNNPYLRSIKLYTDKELYTLADFLEKANDVHQEDWYRAVLECDGNYWWVQNGKIYIGKKIMSAYPPKAIGIIRVQVKNELFQDSFAIFRDTPVGIEVRQDGQAVYTYYNERYSGSPGFEQYITLPIKGWEIVYRIDQQYYDSYALLNLLPSLLIIATVLVLVCSMMIYFSKKLSRDLGILQQEVLQAQNGNLDVIIEPSEVIEIQTLGQGIKVLLDRIKQLIHEVYGKEIQRQNLELNLLQSKMQPHFLYNTLSSISWLALECEQEKIYRITTELAAFYRTALNKGRNIDKLSVELANIRAYVNLQQMSHEESFDVEYQIPQEVVNTLVPIFILQPLVENSIEHGVDQLRTQRGKILIQAEQKKQWLILRVWDNGETLYQQIGASVLSIEQYGYGTSNVHKRLQLLCGEQSGLAIWAEKEGTTAEIRIHCKNLEGQITL